MKRGRHCEKYRPDFGTFCPEGIKFAPHLKTCNLHEMHKWQAMQVWPHLPFLTGRGPSKMLVGEPPQTRLFGTKCPKEVGCVTAAVAAFLIISSSYWQRHLFIKYFHQALPTFTFFNSIPMPQRCSNSDFNSSVV